MINVKNVLQQLTEEKNPIRFLVGKILQRTGLCYFITIYRNGYALRFYPSALSATLWINNEERDNDEEFLKTQLSSGDVFVDVGSNIGALSVLGSTLVGPEGRVVSVEPHPITFKYLKGNIDYNNLKNVKAYNLAIGQKEGFVMFKNTRSDDQNKVLIDGEVGGIKVKLTKLDQLTKNLKSIKLLKVDVEGFEFDVFKGADQTLKKVDIIYFESWETHFNRYGIQTGDVISYLETKGFIVEKAGMILTSNYKSHHCENLIARTIVKE